MGEDFERRQKFLPEIVLPAADAGERRGGADHRALAGLRAVIGLYPPDGGDDVAIDPIRLLDRVEDGTVLGQDRAAVLDAILAHQQIQIVPDRLGEFRLGVEQIHDPQVRRERGGLRIEHGARYPAPLCLGPQRFETGMKICRGGPNGIGGHQRMSGGAGFSAPFRSARRRRRGRRGSQRRRGGYRTGGQARNLERKPASIGGLRQDRPRHGDHDRRRGTQQTDGAEQSRHALPLHHFRPTLSRACAR
jgi:hypothetical protein